MKFEDFRVLHPGVGIWRLVFSRFAISCPISRYIDESPVVQTGIQTDFA